MVMISTGQGTPGGVLAGEAEGVLSRVLLDLGSLCRLYNLILTRWYGFIRLYRLKYEK